MSRAHGALSVLVVACLGLWGCAQGAANGRASADRLRALETKIAKLEGDFRAVVAVRDQLRKQLTAAEQERTELGQQVEKLQGVAKERDELRQQLATRTSERDSVQSQFEQFRNGIKTLLGQAEARGTSNTPPVTAASEGQGQGKS
jgi:septal ring factor EnvC (AmiA/AmiB activator)